MILFCSVFLCAVGPNCYQATMYIMIVTALACISNFGPFMKKMSWKVNNFLSSGKNRVAEFTLKNWERILIRKLMKKLRDLLYKVRGGAVKIIYPKYYKDSNESCNFDVFDRKSSTENFFSYAKVFSISDFFLLIFMSKTKTNFLYIVVSKLKVAKHESEKKTANVSF